MPRPACSVDVPAGKDRPPGGGTDPAPCVSSGGRSCGPGWNRCWKNKTKNDLQPRSGSVKALERRAADRFIFTENLRDAASGNYGGGTAAGGVASLLLFCLAALKNF
ncbi:MAG: hypothetical protein PUH69_06175 [Faecalibacterium prausnitzii]|nr:hypothetical protein [Faecalibacterium prausnitzii]